MLVLDTGLPEAAALPGVTRGGWHEASEATENGKLFDRADMLPDGYVDPAAGHGIFIAGIIKRHAPDATVYVDRLLDNYGRGLDVEIAARLRLVKEQKVKNPDGPPHIINMSFSGYTAEDEEPQGVGPIIRELHEDYGVIFVGAAGNDGSCRKTWPASLPGVLSVGAVGPDGPAWFTNWGPWVQVCAPGVDIISNFFDDPASAKEELPHDSKLDEYNSGWAVWSGSSFATPMVCAALARQMLYLGRGPEQALSEILDNPEALRIPNLGAVVTLS